jgi:citrate synthase
MSSLSADDAAGYLGVSRRTLYAYVSRGLLVSEPSSGKARRYPLWALDELRARRAERREPAAAALRWGTPVLESGLTHIEDGHLYYRGRDAVTLSRSATFEQVAALLWEAGADDLFPARPSRPATRGPVVDRLIAALVRERAKAPLSLVERSPATLRRAAATVTSLFAAAGATGGGPLAGRLARGWRTDPGDLQAALILCADHGLSASSFTARIVGATDAPLHNALLAALCALEGRRHGGASSLVGDLFDEVERDGVTRACNRLLDRHGRLPGFWSDSSLYADGDPRAAEILRRLDLPVGDLVTQTIDFARGIGGTPTIELALAAFVRSHGLPRDASFGLFALGRSVGWIAHALEAAGGALIRPRARYVGPRPTPYGAEVPSRP